MPHRALPAATPVATVVLLFATPSCTSAPEEVHATTAELVQGTTTSEPAVVMLVAFDGNVRWLCSGTLVAPRVVLTAAHCLSHEVAPFDPVPGMRAYFADQLSISAPSVEVVRAEMAPDWTPQNGTRDVGMVELASDAPEGIEPLPIHRGQVRYELTDPLTPLRLLGFGQTNDAISGTLREQTVTAYNYGGEALHYDDLSLCPGDSGGPALLDFGLGEEIVAVHSRGEVTAETCGLNAKSQTLFFRLGWIDEFLAATAPSCRSDGRCVAGCAAADPDCEPSGPDASAPTADAGNTISDTGGCSTTGGVRTTPPWTWLLVLGALANFRVRRRR